MKDSMIDGYLLWLGIAFTSWAMVKGYEIIDWEFWVAIIIGFLILQLYSIVRLTEDSRR